MRLDTTITSPRRIANGQGAWTGTLAQAIHAHYWEFVTEVEASTGEIYDEQPTLAELAEHITAEMIEEVLDDPNAEVNHE